MTNSSTSWRRITHLTPATLIPGDGRGRYDISRCHVQQCAFISTIWRRMNDFTPTTLYCEIIFIRWTLKKIVGKSIHEYVKFLFNLVSFSWNISSVYAQIFLVSTYGKGILHICSLKQKFPHGYCRGWTNVSLSIYHPRHPRHSFLNGIVTPDTLFSL